jgi:outer membrane protein OmpA-like peptidoglycan-associated protein
MKAWLAVGAFGLLAGCGAEPAPEATATASSSVLTGAVSGQPGSADKAPATGSGLRAQVSNLTADISGLNTRVTDQGLVIDLPADALFEFDKADLTAAAETELRKAAELIRASPPGPIAVIGHTDTKGDDAYNQQLSEARARTVREWFGGQVGVRQRQFEVSGKGEAAPIAPNARPDGSDDPAGRAKNRRVEVIVPSK